MPHRVRCELAYPCEKFCAIHSRHLHIRDDNFERPENLNRGEGLITVQRGFHIKNTMKKTLESFEGILVVVNKQNPAGFHANFLRIMGRSTRGCRRGLKRKSEPVETTPRNPYTNCGSEKLNAFHSSAAIVLPRVAASQSSSSTTHRLSGTGGNCQRCRTNLRSSRVPLKGRDQPELLPTRVFNLVCIHQADYSGHSCARVFRP